MRELTSCTIPACTVCVLTTSGCVVVVASSGLRLRALRACIIICRYTEKLTNRDRDKRLKELVGRSSWQIRMAPTLRALVALACACLLPAAAALRSPPAGLNRRALLGGAAATLTTLVGSPANAAYMNQAEQKLQDMLAEKVAAQEKELGFKFEAEDIAGIEEILRNKYCGKSGLFGAMEGGTCEDNVVAAAYCPDTGSGAAKQFSGSSGCAPPPKPKANNGVFEGPPKVPELPTLSVPKLPF